MPLGKRRLGLVGEIVDAIAEPQERYREAFSRFGYEISMDAYVHPQLNGATVLGITCEAEPKGPTGAHGHSRVPVWRGRWFSSRPAQLRSIEEALAMIEESLQGWLEQLASGRFDASES